MKARQGGRAVAVLALMAALVATLGPGTSSPAAAHPTGAEGVAAGKVVYDGSGVRVWRHSGQIDRLSETTTSFRLFVRAQLDYMWHEYTGSDEACAQAPLVVVKEFRRRVAYIDNQGTFGGGPGDAPDSCASGGAFRFYVKRDGDWLAPFALGGQEVLRCRVFRRWDIPRMNGARVCYDGDEIVSWNP